MITPTKEFLEIFKSTNGALSVTESIAIMNIAAQAPKGLCIEFGTYHGKSAMSAIIGLRSGSKFILVDPIFKNVALANMVLIKVYDTQADKLLVYTIPDISLNEIIKHDNYSYVFIDSGSHQDGLPMQEVKLLEDRIVPNGIIAFHDYNSQFSEVKEAYDYLISTGKFEEIPINWGEIIEHVNANNLEDGNSSWHHNELKNPCFAGAVKRK